MADVFISYASEDREPARMLAGALAANDWSVWWDRDIAIGQTFDQVIEQELDRARCVIVLWSRHSVGSEWVRNEAAVAAEAGILVPAMIEKVRLPLAFRRKQTADLSDWAGQDSHPEFQALCGGIAAAIGKEAPPLPPTRLPGKKRRNRGWVYAAASVAAIALLVGLFRLLPVPGPVSEPGPKPQPSGLCRDTYEDLVSKQREAVEMLGIDREKAISLIDDNFQRADRAYRSCGGDIEFLTLLGYAAKDVYQSSKGLLPAERRQDYLVLSRQSFEEAIAIDPDNASAHNGLGNVLFFEGNFDAAIEQHEKALRLSGGNYPDAEHDRDNAEKVKAGEIPFEY